MKIVQNEYEHMNYEFSTILRILEILEIEVFIIPRILEALELCFRLFCLHLFVLCALLCLILF